ncbi:unnamed protein product [Mucor fragilis]
MALFMNFNVKALGGDLLSSKRQNALLATIQESPSKHVKLEQLPFSTYSTCSYGALIYHFKETLKSISFKLFEDDNVDVLYAISSSFGLYSPQLKNLRLGLSQSLDSVHVDHSNLGKNFLENVETVEIMKTIRLQYGTNCCGRSGDAYIIGPDLFEYLPFKYPAVGNLFIGGYHPNRQHIYPAFKHLDTFHLERWVFMDFDGLEQFINASKRQSNS